MFPRVGFANQTSWTIARSFPCSVRHSSKRECEDDRKGRVLLGKAFYSQFVFICPPLPSAAFGSDSALVLLAVTVCQGANRFFLTGAGGGHVSVPFLCASAWTMCLAHWFPLLWLLVSICAYKHWYRLTQDSSNIMKLLPSVLLIITFCVII